MTNRAYEDWLDRQREQSRWWEGALVASAIVMLLSAIIFCGVTP